MTSLTTFLAILVILTTTIQCRNELECDIRPVTSTGIGVEVECFPIDTTFNITICGMHSATDQCRYLVTQYGKYYIDRGLRPYSDYNITAKRTDTNYSRVFHFKSYVDTPTTSIILKNGTTIYSKNVSNPILSDTSARIFWDITFPDSLNGPPTGFRFEYCYAEECKRMDVHGHSTRDVTISGLKPATDYNITGWVFNVDKKNKTLINYYWFSETIDVTTSSKSGTVIECNTKPSVAINGTSKISGSFSVECPNNYNITICEHNEKGQCKTETTSKKSWDVKKELKAYTEYNVTVLTADGKFSRAFHFKTDVNAPKTGLDFKKAMSPAIMDDSIRIFWDIEDPDSINGPPTGFHFKYCSSHGCQEIDVPEYHTRTLNIKRLKPSTTYNITGWIYNINNDKASLVDRTFDRNISITTAALEETKCDAKPLLYEGRYGQSVSLRCAPRHKEYRMLLCGAYNLENTCKNYTLYDEKIDVTIDLKPYSDFNATVSRKDTNLTKMVHFRTDVGQPRSKITFSNVSLPVESDKSVQIFWDIEKPAEVFGPPTGFKFEYCSEEACAVMQVFGSETRDIEIHGLNSNTTYNVTGWIININSDNTTLENRLGYANTINVTTQAFESDSGDKSDTGKNEPTKGGGNALAIGLSVAGVCIVGLVIGLAYWKYRTNRITYMLQSKRPDELDDDQHMNL